MASTLCVVLGSASSTDPAAISAATMTDAAAKTIHDAIYDSLELVVVASELADVYDSMELSRFTKILSPNATVSVSVIGDATKSLSPIHTSFLLAGLANNSERRNADGSRTLTATRRNNTTNSVATLNFASNNNNGNDLLIDEDNLLTDASNLLGAPPSMSAAATKSGDDCSGRAPCDDCTCGRAEGAKEGNSEQPKEIKSSSCGKCSLGDAFRCASCPYLGKPAFKPGEEHLVLDLQDDF